jgi:arabinogalactan endo-1,4-beta-galactosidase
LSRSFFPFFLIKKEISAQNFYFGSDLSYVNEMEDCGVIYKDNNVQTDCYQIFANHGTNLVRLRLWHTPAWYDTLNSGKRFSDLADVKKSILRAKTAGMSVLLDFQLSDTWADPQHQIVPKAWLAVVDNLPVLQDSLYNYVHSILKTLDSEGLLPEMVQIGNETNRGILQTEAANNAGWVLNWARNAALFKKAIQAVRAVENETGKTIKVALHIAGPADAGWLMDGFWSNGVKDFDVIGLSYYWAWHKPTTIAQAGDIISTLKTKYSGKKVMIFETGYIWTTAANDAANNIIDATHPNYAPASPANQQKWLTDLTQMVINKGGSGVMYWEPAWVSSNCWTQWGHGSHQENATFFDYDENVLPAGGMFWPTFPFQNLVSEKTPIVEENISIETFGTADSAIILIKIKNGNQATLQMNLLDSTGKIVDYSEKVINDQAEWRLKKLPAGIYFLAISGENMPQVVRKLPFF